MPAGYNFRRGSGYEGHGGGVAKERESGLEAEGVFLDDGVGEDLVGDAFDFLPGCCGIGGEGVFESEQEVLSLADIGDAVVLHAAERAGDGLALGIEHGPLESDIHMRLHEV